MNNENGNQNVNGVNSQAVNPNINGQGVDGNQGMVQNNPNTVVNDSYNNVTSVMNEVSVIVDSNQFNQLSENEIGANSVFRTKPEVDNNQKGINTVEEEKNTKSKFPVLMIIFFLLLAIATFFIDDISKFIDQKMGKPDEEDEVKEPVNENNDGDDKKEENDKPVAYMTMDEIYDAINKSNFSSHFIDKNYGVTIANINNNLMINFTELDENGQDKMIGQLDGKVENGILVVVGNNGPLMQEAMVIIVREIALHNGSQNNNLDEYLNNSFTTQKLDEGLEFKVLENGTFEYRVDTSIRLNIEG